MRNPKPHEHYQQMDTDDLTGSVLNAIFEVANTLGAGFLEKVYQRALLKELKMTGLDANAEVSFPVIYKGHPVGQYYADVIVENTVVIELKCVDRFAPEHLAQCLNYLKASRLKLCLLINFQKPTLTWKRIIL